MPENTLVQIFFIITGFAVVIITVAITALVLYIISFIKTVKKVVTTANRAAEIISEDAMALRESLKTKGLNASALITFVKSMIKLKNMKGKK